MQSVAGHALLSAGFITYLANMVEAERSRLIASWLQALTVSGLLGGLGGDGPGALAARDSMTTGGFSLLTFLSSEGTLLRWKAQVIRACLVVISACLVNSLSHGLPKHLPNMATRRASQRTSFQPRTPS